MRQVLHPTSQAGSFKISDIATRISDVPLMFSVKSYLSRIFPVAFLLLSACNQSAPSADPLTKLEIEALRDRVTRTEGRLNSLESRSARSVSFKPSDRKFQFVHTEMGALAVSIVDVAADGNGSRVRLKFGNTSGGSILRLSFSLGWGVTGSDGEPVPGQDHNRKEEALDLYGASWVEKSYTLDDTPPAKLGYITVTDPEIERITMTPR